MESPFSKKNLIEKKGISEEQASAVAHLAEGNFNEALNLLDNTENDNALLFLEWMRICYLGDGIKIMDWVERFSKIGRENQKHFLWTPPNWRLISNNLTQHNM